MGRHRSPCIPKSPCALERAGGSWESSAGQDARAGQGGQGGRGGAGGAGGAGCGGHKAPECDAQRPGPPAASPNPLSRRPCAKRQCAVPPGGCAHLQGGHLLHGLIGVQRRIDMQGHHRVGLARWPRCRRVIPLQGLDPELHGVQRSGGEPTQEHQRQPDCESCRGENKAVSCQVKVAGWRELWGHGQRQLGLAVVNRAGARDVAPNLHGRRHMHGSGAVSFEHSSAVDPCATPNARIAPTKSSKTYKCRSALHVPSGPG
jgi:hypothetical protein